MSDARPSWSAPKFTPGDRVAVLRTRWNTDIVDKLHAAAAARLHQLGAAVEDHVVPGAFELPTAASWAAKSGRFAAVICLGCVIRGDTPHFDFVAGGCATGLREVGQATGVPVIFGVLTVNTHEQAVARAGGEHGDAGLEAADAAAGMVAVKRAIHAG
ncbi:MAG: 6,7-dimethyl-8-ribityllumazine synthase [Planctomycetota bacterium]